MPQKRFIFFKIQNSENSENFLGPPFLGSFWAPGLFSKLFCGKGLNYIYIFRRFDYLSCFLIHGNA